MRLQLVALLVLLLLGGCGGSSSSEPTFFAGDNPPLLSAWGQVLRDGDALVLGSGVQPYALNTPLFTDYAHKLRTIWLPTTSSFPARTRRRCTRLTWMTL